MATVRVTKDLIEQIKTNIRGISKVVLEKTVQPQNPALKPDIKAELVELGLIYAWGKYVHLRNVIPSEWMVKKERLDITVGDLREVWIYLDSYCLPPRSATGLYGTSTYFEVRVAKEEVREETYNALAAYQALLQEHDEKYKRIDDMVIGFIKSSKSLNDAIKRFPDIVLYVPDDIKRKLEEKVERTTIKEKREAVWQPELTDEQRQLISSTGVLGTLIRP
jgi:hypothetical protein